jgi:hypothetical protein
MRRPGFVGAPHPEGYEHERAAGISRSPSAGALKKVATSTVTPLLLLYALWTWPRPGSTNAVPVGYLRQKQSPLGSAAT